MRKEKNRQFVCYGVNALDLKEKRKYCLLKVNKMSNEQRAFTIILRLLFVLFAIGVNMLMISRSSFLSYRAPS